MSSRKEEERNEKIIRGLMKLPPNRRCINCSSLGPQYVCTNFWTFICMACSGIHREFTHRVKSVSMAKFTSLEVQALQNGGNQRARDIYLKDWDFQTQRLPISSNVDKVRDFIKIVYVDRRYAGGKASEKPPRDTQSPTIRAAETRRASSYHSYSQSPPYDDQYEDRRYGKQAAILSRKFGSDGGRHKGKMSNFICSPGRFSDQSFEERCANVESSQRVPDYSACSGGDPFKYDVQSPKFHEENGFSSPLKQPFWGSSGEYVGTQASISSLETIGKKLGDGIPHLQFPKITSSGSFGSLESDSFSLKSYSSGGLVDFFSEPEQGACSPRENDSNLLQQRGPARCDSLGPSKAPFAPLTASSGSSINLFQLPASSQVPSVAGLQPPSLKAGSKPAASLDLFANMSPQHSTATTNNTIEHSVLENEGWATFDTPQWSASTANIVTDPRLHNDVSLSEKFEPVPVINSNMQISSLDTPNLTSAFRKNNPRYPTSDKSSIENFDPLSSLHGNFQLPSFENYVTSGSGQMKSNPWDDILPNAPAPVAEPWNAFLNANKHLSTEIDNQSLRMDNFVSSEDQHLRSEFFEECDVDKIPNVDFDIGFPDNDMLSQNISSLSFLPPKGETCKSHNPFDQPFDFDSEQSNMFLDMSSLKGSLPNCPLHSIFNIDVPQPWLSHNPVPVPPYISSAGLGGLTSMTAQHPTSCEISSVQSQGPVASMGGNPFA